MNGLMTVSRKDDLYNDGSALFERIPQAQQLGPSKGSSVLTAAAIICRGCPPTEYASQKCDAVLRVVSVAKKRKNVFCVVSTAPLGDEKWGETHPKSASCTLEQQKRPKVLPMGRQDLFTESKWRSKRKIFHLKEHFKGIKTDF